MNNYRFSFRWVGFTWEFTIWAYNLSNAIERARVKIIESGRELNYIEAHIFENGVAI